MIATKASLSDHRRTSPSYAEAREALEGIEGDFQKLATQTQDENGLPKQTDLHFNSAKNDGGDFSVMRSVIQGLFNDMVALRNDYLKALNDGGHTRLLDADRVARDASFRDSYEILAKSRRTVYAYRQKANDLLEGFPQRVEKYALKKALKQSLLEGYSKGLPAAMAPFKETWDIEISLVDTAGELLEFLEASRKSWSPQGGKFIFQRSEDLDQFNAIMAKIASSVERQNEIRDNALKTASSAFSILKEDLPKR